MADSPKESLWSKWWWYLILFLLIIPTGTGLIWSLYWWFYLKPMYVKGYTFAYTETQKNKNDHFNDISSKAPAELKNSEYGAKGLYAGWADANGDKPFNPNNIT